MADLTPRTEAGRRLLDHERRDFGLATVADILAIEAEAALTASRERERRLREALVRLDHAYGAAPIGGAHLLTTARLDAWNDARAALLDTESPAPVEEAL